MMMSAAPSSSLQVIVDDPTVTKTTKKKNGTGSLTPLTEREAAEHVASSPSEAQRTTASTSPSPSSSLDFVGCHHQAVKDLFSFPYANDRPISVAVHNVDGTLLLDLDPGDRRLSADADREEAASGGTAAAAASPSTVAAAPTATTTSTPPPPRLPRKAGGVGLPPLPDGDGRRRHDGPQWDPGLDVADGRGEGENEVEKEDMTRSLVALPSLEPSKSSEALTIVNSVIESVRHGRESSTQERIDGDRSPASLTAARRREKTTGWGVGATLNDNQLLTTQDEHGCSGGVALGVPRPDAYAHRYIPPSPEPREYLSWKFHDMNLLVGSDALIYRSPEIPPSSSQSQSPSPQSSSALTVRVEDAKDMEALLRRHQEMVRSGQFVPDHRLPELQQMGKRSYAEAARRTTTTLPQIEEGKNSTEYDDEEDDDDKKGGTLAAGSFSAPDLDQVRLQTCIVPAPTSSVGGLLSAAEGGNIFHHMESQNDDSKKVQPSPVSTVLDVYLDNIMANVPQLALCLQERGFIRSVKLLRTDEIPSVFMRSSTFDTSTPFDILKRGGNGGGSSPDAVAEDIFSPRIMEMNASTLLRFLKTNCTRDNATYLLRREAGQANIQLYDVSSISAQRQKKWIWWLAMMSYRFANRLSHLSLHAGGDGALRRNFRARQRSLLQNTLDMLEVLSDMDDGSAHESLVAAIRESLANTFLAAAGAAGASAQCDHGEPAAGLQAAEGKTSKKATSTTGSPEPATSVSSRQPYGKITVDALNKAHDHLASGIKVLGPVLKRIVKHENLSAERRRKRTARDDAIRSAPPPPPSSSSSSFVVVSSIRSEDVTSSDEDDDDDDGSSSEDDDREDEDDRGSKSILRIDPVATQLFGLHHKLVNVSLRLAEVHLKNYWSSSAMQSLREAARLIADSLYLVRLLSSTDDGNCGGGDDDSTRLRDWLTRLKLQYTWLWEHCGHFARSFAGDVELWRDRGHASGEDVVSVLQDVETAFVNRTSDLLLEDLENGGDDAVEPRLLPSLEPFVRPKDPLYGRSNGTVHLNSLSGIVGSKQPPGEGWIMEQTDIKSGPRGNDSASAATEAAIRLLHEKPVLQREQRKVLVAACVSYQRAIHAFFELSLLQGGGDGHDEEGEEEERGGDGGGNRNNSRGSAHNNAALLGLLQQRLGDACNETGKILLTELRNLLQSSSSSTTTSSNGGSPLGALSVMPAEPLLSSAEFWFREGLRAFGECRDLRNLALLRCNLCQCCKLRANAVFGCTKSKSKKAAAAATVPLPLHGSAVTHAEECLQEAADHLQSAHESLGQRDADPTTWDMVSGELAATFLVLGVRRRQSLIGSGNTMPLISHALRLSPGEERRILDPMERALAVYEQMGNGHQAAATHYQLALFYSKIWTCQRDEAKTREKLSAAFGHYNAAHAYFSRSVRGNEATFALLCMDLSNLYKVVSGDNEECLVKALRRCLDTAEAFSPAAVKHHSASVAGHPTIRSEWFRKMDTLSSSVEERVFQLIRDLVKLTLGDAAGNERYKCLYRAGLKAKMSAAAPRGGGDECSEVDEFGVIGGRLMALHRVLEAIKKQFHQVG